MKDDNANSDPISAALNITPMIPGDEPGQVMKLIGEAFDDSAKSDFTTARANLYKLIDTGMLSLERLAEIAAQSQHPRAFEVVSTMIDTMMAANEKLLDLQTKIRALDNTDATTGNGPQVINNNLFVGSTQELLKTLKNMNDKQLDDGTPDISG